MNKYDKYNNIKNKLIELDIDVDTYNEINFGIQFYIYFKSGVELVRIYESKKKGVTLDLSQFKFQENRNVIISLNDGVESTKKTFQNSTSDTHNVEFNISNLELSENLSRVCLQIQNILLLNNIKIADLKKINYGVQINLVFPNNDKELLRIYESEKKGVRADLTQFKNKFNVDNLESLNILNSNVTIHQKNNSTNKSKDAKISKKVNKKYTSEKINPLDFEDKVLIGTDESGKGDFFGPLVVAGVYADLKQQEVLKTLGITDSKKLSDKEIIIFAQQIKKLCSYDVVVIGNERYNQMYEKNKNINTLLAWGHARVIENILKNVECTEALADQFGNPQYIENALMKNGKNIILHQRTKAEQNVVVAAASILARERFVIEIDKMCEKYGIHFYKGASNKTIESGKLYVSKYGYEFLNLVSKTHFKTINKI